MSRWENAPDLRTLIRLTYAMVDLWCGSYWRPPKAITLDIDDTADTVHGHQQLSLFKPTMTSVAFCRSIYMTLRPATAC